MHELFSSGELDDAEVDEIFADEAQDFEMPVSDFNFEEYLRQRRKLLGPAADIMHPEFGRPNRPEETFSVFYRAKETLVAKILDVDEEGSKVYYPVHNYRIDEYIFDYEDGLVNIDTL